MTEEAPKRQLFIEHFFGNGFYKFQLNQQQMRELEDLTGAGIGAVYKRMVTGTYYATDVSQILRLGIVGGASGKIAGDQVKITDRMAADLVSRYQDAMPMTDKWAIAAACIGAAMIGVVPEEFAPIAAEDAQSGSSE
jgi:hypothetical protein